MHRTLRGLLVAGAFIASLFAVMALGEKLGGKWVLLFPAYDVLLLAAVLLYYRRRRGWSLRGSSSRIRGPMLILVVAITTGLLSADRRMALSRAWARPSVG